MDMPDTPSQVLAISHRRSEALEYFYLLTNTFILRPYVFVFLGVSLYIWQKLLGWRRTGRFFGLTWAIAFICEYASTRIGIPFGDYFYTGSTQDHELDLSNIPFMDSLSFSFLLFASYCLALIFVLTPAKRGGPTGMAIRSGIKKLMACCGINGGVVYLFGCGDRSNSPSG